ncbi:MAG: hypothetical protein EPO68_14205 [Planctomycetota bacterium]|nr:MAG: hypothetical protein EPO68_14205 [Planctomycetota bacterium]
MSSAEPAADPKRERLFRWLLIGLIALVPLVYVPRVLFGPRADAPTLRTPQWVHTLIVTAARVAPGTFEKPGPELAALIRRGSLTSSLWAPSRDTRAAAASLWCGRWPRQLGVLEPEARVADGTWTLATAASAAGTATLSIGAPLALPGFAERIDARDPAVAGAEAAAFVERSTGKRLLVWVHLEWADAAALEAVLEPLQRALERTDRRFDALTMVSAFAQGPRDGEAVSLACPLATALPAALFSGRRADALISHVDIAGLLAGMLQLQPPVAQRGQPQLASRAQPLWGAIRGSRTDLPVLIQDRDGEDLLISIPGQPLNKLARVRATLPLAGQDSIETWLPGPDGPVRAEGEARAALAKQYLQMAASAR